MTTAQTTAADRETGNGAARRPAPERAAGDLAEELAYYRAIVLRGTREPAPDLLFRIPLAPPPTRGER